MKGMGAGGGGGVGSSEEDEDRKLFGDGGESESLGSDGPGRLRGTSSGEDMNGTTILRGHG